MAISNDISSRCLRSCDNFYKMFKPSDYHWVFLYSLGIITSLLRKYLGCKKSFYAIFKFLKIFLIVMHRSTIPYVANVSHIYQVRHYLLTVIISKIYFRIYVIYLWGVPSENLRWMGAFCLVPKNKANLLKMTTGRVDLKS